MAKFLFVLCLAVFMSVASCKQAERSGSSINSNNRAYGTTDIYRFDGGSNGCGDFFIYRSTADKAKVIAVEVDKAKLKISDKPQVFEIGKSKDLDVYIVDFGKGTYEDREGYCYDVIALREGELPPIRIQGTSGRAIIYTSENPYKTYDANVILENVTFQDADTLKEFSIDSVEIKNVRAGWIPG